jgi:hypothetical protein
VCGRPTARETAVAERRNNIAELARFLDRSHGGDYLVVNLSNKKCVAGVEVWRGRNGWERVGGGAPIQALATCEVG